MKKSKKRAESNVIEVGTGNAVVKIYRSERRKKDAKGNKVVYSQFDVAEYVPHPKTGLRVRKFKAFADEAEARKYALEIASNLHKGKGAAASLPDRDKEIYLRSVELVKPTGVPLELVAAQFAEAHLKLG